MKARIKAKRRFQAHWASEAPYREFRAQLGKLQAQLDKLTKDLNLSFTLPPYSNLPTSVL